MPVTGNLKLSPGSKSKPDEGYRSRFSHDEESASPGYYKVRSVSYTHLTERQCAITVSAFPQSGKASAVRYPAVLNISL